MNAGVQEFPDASTRLKIPITPEQYDYYKRVSLILKPGRLVGRLEFISQE